MAQYLLSVIHPEMTEMPPTDEMEQTFKAVDAFNAELMTTGSFVFGGGLHPPSSATVVSSKDGEVSMTDGPYVETKEQLGGFWVVTAPDLDAALEWGAKGSAACGQPVEVRSFQDEPES